MFERVFNAVRVNKQFLAISHNFMHLDEITSLWAIIKYGTSEFFEKYCIKNAISLGVNGGAFDEHPSGGQPRKEGECCLTLVLKALGVYEKPSLQKIIQFVVNGDLKGGSNPFDLKSLVDSMYNTKNEDDVIQWAFSALDAKELQQREFCEALEEIKGNGVEERVLFNDKQLVIMSICSDNKQAGKAARQLGADIVVQKNSKGNVQIFTNSKKIFPMAELARIIRVEEQLVKGKLITSNWKSLEREEAVEGAEEWYYFIKGQTLFNGSLTTSTAPTLLLIETIVNLVKIAMDTKKFYSKNKIHCEAGKCISSLKNPCPFYAYGLGRCKTIRYQQRIKI